MKTGKIAVSILAILMLFFVGISLQAATYEVGPTKPLTAIAGSVGVVAGATQF